MGEWKMEVARRKGVRRGMTMRGRSLLHDTAGVDYCCQCTLILFWSLGVQKACQVCKGVRVSWLSDPLCCPIPIF